MPDTRISVIIPAYNEECYLPRLLDSIDVARRAYSFGAERIEVIVADNASTDLTAEIAASRGYNVARVSKRAIAAARNGGAAIATGQIFCFIDADSAVHPESFNAVDEAVLGGRYVAGTSGVYPERVSIGLFVTYCVMLPMIWLTGMDTGLVFARGEDFRAIGGYDEDLLYGEDVKFLWSLRTLGRRRGQTLVRLKNVKALGSTRKFDKHGDWHYFTMGIRVMAGLLMGRINDRELAEKYWYCPER